MKNTGTATSTLIGIFINDEEVDVYGATIADTTLWVTTMGAIGNPSQSITSGAVLTESIYIGNSKPGLTLSSGTTINVKIHSAGGMDYIKLIELV